jgi:hypothetical protein
MDLRITSGINDRGSVHSVTYLSEKTKENYRIPHSRKPSLPRIQTRYLSNTSQTLQPEV